MIKKFSIKIYILLIIIVIITGYLFISTTITGNDKFADLKLLLNDNQRELIKKYIFPYKLISQQQQRISQQQQTISQQQQTISEKQEKLNLIDWSLLEKQQQTISKQELTINKQEQKLKLINWSVIELEKKREGSEITTKESIIKLSNNKTLKKYKLNSGFYAGMHLDFPGSGYIDFYKNNIIIISARGVLAFKKNIQDTGENFKQIKNNINEFIGINQFKKSLRFSLKDIFISNNKIFVSYTEEIKEDCWNTSVIFADLNFENIQFEKLFSPKECVHSIYNIDKQFNPHSSGGRIQSFDKNNILLSVGEYLSRYLAQEKTSVNGKIIKINIKNSEHEIISMGHRNPQGLYFDKKNNFILETEHGPQGGDEINLIEVSKINKDKIQNYGWAISSAGEHYGGKNEKNKKKYEKYPLYNSHIEHGFIEPLYSFVPSIGISEIVKIGKNKYVVSSLRDKSLYFFGINEQKKIIDLKRVEVFERVRDLRFNDNQLYLFMENTASVGVINLN